MPIKDPEKRKAANRRYRESVAAKAGRVICEKAGQQRKIPRCDNCPLAGDPCRDCYNAHRRTYRVKEKGYTTPYTPVKRTKPVKPKAERPPVMRAPKKEKLPKPVKERSKKPKPFRHRIAVEVKPVVDFLSSELFGCPGCMRKMRGAYRYCDRCEAKNNGAV